MATPGNDTRTHLRNFTHLHLFVPYVCHTNAFVLGLPVVLDRASTWCSEISYWLKTLNDKVLCQLTIALETFRTKSTNRTYHLLPYNLYTPKIRSFDFERWSIASSCDILLVYNAGLGCRRGDLSLLTFSGESITGQSKNNGLIYKPLAGEFAIFWRRNMALSLCHFFFTFELGIPVTFL